MRYCCIIVVGKQGFGTAMLIRAVEPLDDTTKKLLYQCRPGHAGNGLSNGPAKLCKTIGIDTTFNGHDLTKMPLKLQMKILS